MALDLDSMDRAHCPAGTDTPTACGTMAPTIPTHGVTPHDVPTPHALQRWPPWPTLTSIEAYDPIITSEATKFGKDFLSFASHPGPFWADFPNLVGIWSGSRLGPIQDFKIVFLGAPIGGILRID